MNVHFHRDLVGLQKRLAKMGHLVQENLCSALAALDRQDVDLARQAIAADKEIDAYENTVNDDILKMLAMYQPVADDLRLVMTMWFANGELERMGDHAKKVAKIAVKLAPSPELRIPGQISDAGDVSKNMLNKAMQCLTDSDIELAKTVRDLDDQVDAAYDAAMDMLRDRLRTQQGDVDVNLALLDVAREIERIADLSVNIAKEVMFLVTGDVVKHGGATAE